MNVNRQPAGTPTGGQFATGARTETGTSLAAPSKATVPFAGAGKVDLRFLQDLPDWPATLPPVRHEHYTWTDEGELEVAVTFGDDTFTIWGTADGLDHSIDGLPDEWDHLSAGQRDDVIAYGEALHGNLRSVVGEFEYAVHSAPGVRMSLLAAAHGQRLDVPMPGTEGWTSYGQTAAARAESAITSTTGATDIGEEQIQDALTDLMHLAQAKGIGADEFFDLVERARDNYNGELDEDRSDAQDRADG